MNKAEIITRILQCDIIKKWHWFKYHFSFYQRGLEHSFAKSIVDAIFDIEQKIEGAGMDLLSKLSSINGVEKDLHHYEQLMQVLSELLIIHKAVTYNWENLEKFEYEPTIVGSKKNPELNIQTSTSIIGIEVKSPNLNEHQKNRRNNPFQLTSRNPLVEILTKKKITYPRDNPIKDFLISANEKFAPFKAKYKNYISVLYIVWDDYINEPISGLLSEPHGLFKSKSFAINRKGEILKFENVDFVMISRHRFQFQQTAGEKPYPYAIKHALDYGEKNEFPFKVVIKNPHTNVEDIKDLVECFQVYAPCMEMGAEYYPGDFIMWMDDNDIPFKKRKIKKYKKARKPKLRTNRKIVERWFKRRRSKRTRIR